MARLLHKPRIFQQDHSPKKSNVRQLRKKFYVDPFLCSTTPIIAAMPNKENDAEGDVQSRKRISLACQRCRKRKIKCEPSGDAGDGQACVACQAAKSNNCQYLRVNSGEVNCHSPDSPYTPWHFSLPTNEETSFSVVPAHDLSQYSINNFNQMALHTGRASHRGANHIDGLGRNPSLSYHTSQQGPFLSMPQQNTMGPDFYPTYQTQHGSAYANSTISPTSFAVPDTSPPWSSSSGCGPAPIDSGLSQHHSIDYGTLQYPDSGYTEAEVSSIRTEESPYFPGLSPLATHLPAPVSNDSKSRFLPVPVQSYLSGSRGPSQASESSFSTANSHFTPETDSDTWTSATLLSDHNSGSVASSGGTESHSPPNTRESSMYEYTPSLGSSNMAGFSPLTLPTIHDPADPQTRGTRVSLGTYPPTYARLPTLDPPFQDYHHPSAGVGAVSATESRSSELNTPRTHRLLQPQPLRTAYSRSLLGSSSIEAGGRDGRKSAAIRRQERKHAGRHQ